MEVHYKREMKHNYLIVEPDEGNKPGYEARMLLNNAVEGLLRFHIKYMDERQSYYYDITSMQPLGRILQNRFIDRGEICQLLIQLHVALRRMEEYLLSEDGLLLDPDYIYVEPEGFRTGLCLVPGMAGNFPDRLSRLLQYLMKKVDHRDKECVVLAYGLYQESLKENFSVEDLMKLVQREGRTVEASAPATPATDFDPHWEQGGGIDASGRQRQSWDEGGDRAAGGAGPGERERRFESGENAGEPGVKWAEAREGEAQKTGTSVPLFLRRVLKQLVVISLIAVGAPAFLYKGAVGSRAFPASLAGSSGCRPVFERGGRYCLCCIWKTDRGRSAPGNERGSVARSLGDSGGGAGAGRGGRQTGAGSGGGISDHAAGRTGGERAGEAAGAEGGEDGGHFDSIFSIYHWKT